MTGCSRARVLFTQNWPAPSSPGSGSAACSTRYRLPAARALAAIHGSRIAPELPPTGESHNRTPFR